MVTNSARFCAPSTQSTPNPTGQMAEWDSDGSRTQKIFTEKIGNGEWLAFFASHPADSQEGSSEAEAIGLLILESQARGGYKVERRP